MLASNSPQLSIVQASQAEIDEIVPLFDEYRKFYEQASNLEAARTFLLERINRKESVFLLARQDGQPDGFAQLFPSFSSVAMRRIWILNDLYVSPAARRIGVATALLDRACAFGVETGAVRLVLATAKDNQSARSLYVENNWQEDELFVHYQRRL